MSPSHRRRSSTIAPATALFLLLQLTARPGPAAAVDVTAALAPYPEFSSFASLLSSSLAPDLAKLNSVTVLAVPNPSLSTCLSASSTTPSPSAIADVLRFHVILQYLPLASLPPSGSVQPTLFQSTGRSSPSLTGSLNISRSADGAATTTRFSAVPSSNSSATLIRQVVFIPYNLSSLLPPSPLPLRSTLVLGFFLLPASSPGS